MAQQCWEPGETHTRDKGHRQGKTPPYLTLEQWLAEMPLRVRWCWAPALHCFYCDPFNNPLGAAFKNASPEGSDL